MSAILKENTAYAPLFPAPLAFDFFEPSIAQVVYQQPQCVALANGWWWHRPTNSLVAPPGWDWSVRPAPPIAWRALVEPPRSFGVAWAEFEDRFAWAICGLNLS